MQGAAPNDQLTLQQRKYTYKSGAVYEGTFRGAMRHGRGHWQHPSGEMYEGEYVGNKPEGLGVYRFNTSGARYVGSWTEGKMHGEGVYFFGAGSIPCYVGTYAADKREGMGFYCYENGVVTAQTYVDGALQKETEATPLQWVEFNQKIDALLRAVRAVAPKSLGEVPPVCSERTFQLPSGVSYRGQYSGTKKQGIGYWEHPEGDWYEGEFEQNKHSGWGVYVVGRSGKKYVGHWRNGKMDGVGIYFFNPQETEYFVGTYKEDMKHGRGFYHFAESGHNKLQLWSGGAIVEEEDGDAVAEGYQEVIKKIIEVVRVVAPRYLPLIIRDKEA
ncbi:unnamed protein product [Trypanosoma congolense IL3000]|uniref:WGS project CAEQ00000000 data, annotated contig 1431 n=1 Tax=Trypanosoma congolense (strain IL3000) TaxID=1068625 RepID=F9W675_TRYCI|nr:unnamed protein product [Trypanosoma congolense IL3000]